MMTTKLKIIAADDEVSIRQYYEEFLSHLGHQVAVAESGEQLVALCGQVQPDLVITDIKMGSKDGLAAAEEINRSREIPVILVSGHCDAALQARAMQDHVMAFLVKPVKGPDLANAVGLAMKRFEQYKSVRTEASNLRQALEERKIVERAKGIVMKRQLRDEDEAFRRIRHLASNRNLRLAEVARIIGASDEIFQELERL